jgi:hypothetical protein
MNSEGTYGRYGLASNPFRELTSDNIRAIDLMHVEQEIDEELNTLREEIQDRESKAVIAILGRLGAGKTERLLLFREWAKKQGYMCIFEDVTMDANALLLRICRSLIENSKELDFVKGFSAPKWFKELQRAEKKSKKDYDPERVATAIANALNSTVPSLLLVNDLHNLRQSPEMERFLQTLQVLMNKIDPGVLIMMSSNHSDFIHFLEINRSLEQRINRAIKIAPLKDEEAAYLLAKRMVARRLVEDMDPLYPFSKESISFLNEVADGNPRQLLRISSIVIEKAAKKKISRIEKGAIEEIMEEEDEFDSLLTPREEPENELSVA